MASRFDILTILLLFCLVLSNYSIVRLWTGNISAQLSLARFTQPCYLDSCLGVFNCFDAARTQTEDEVLGGPFCVCLKPLCFFPFV